MSFMTVVSNLPYEWLVGLRYTRAGKRGGRNRFISFIAAISMAGIALGVAGTAIGVGLGSLLALNVDVIVPAIEQLLGMKFLSKDIYFISALPSDLRWGDVLRIGGVSVLLAFVATLYPSWRAARVKPAQALRYE